MTSAFAMVAAFQHGWQVVDHLLISVPHLQSLAGSGGFGWQQVSA
ncbi:hypothetical protein [Sphingomonas sp. 10B4]|nr:hypothetical protein [Sphingomonas sp. 10B4]MDY7525528.1 hypothetical protein [Sphingomonas sp. 10B4]MEB0281474.1 hypothetical protein [Sphingomonas sp. 10B4]